MYEGMDDHTFFRTAQSSFSATELVADCHEQLSQATFLPWRKDENAGYIVVVPAHLLLAKEAHDLARRGVLIGQHEKVVSECGDIVKD
jgi:hypothetical protein